MRSAYEGADVVLNASRVEGLSNALLEASAAGRAVLASCIPGNQGAVRGESSGPPGGLLYDPTDPRDFTAKALLLLDDPALRAEFGRGGLVRASALPSPEEEAAALAAVYARIHRLSQRECRPGRAGR
jgi:glycosyltransferase involved in cell wall biosynthesis